MRKYLFAVVALLMALTAAAQAKYVFYFIGDGMGQGAIDLTSLSVHGDTRRLVMEQLPIAGLCTTHSKNSAVTDSAASGTAFSCGEKTNNGMIGMTADKRKLKSIARSALELGKSVAIITSDPLHGATPAVFFANQQARGMAAEIIVDASECGFDVLIGQSGSRGFFVENGKEPSQRNLQKEMEDRGYRFVDTPETFAAVPEKAKVVGLVSKKTFVDNDRALGQFTKTAMERLAKNPKGFFMMVESTYPDHGGHSNDPDVSVMGTVHADWAVKYAVEFAAEHGDTLVICTADHETGSLITVMARANGDEPVIYYGGKSHSASPVPVYSYGPMAEQFGGEIDNIEIARFIATMWGFRAPAFME